jgi:hypothetical protein
MTRNTKGKIDGVVSSKVTYALQAPDGWLLVTHMASISGRAPSSAFILTTGRVEGPVFEMDNVEALTEFVSNPAKYPEKRGDQDWPAVPQGLDLMAYRIVRRTVTEIVEAV